MDLSQLKPSQREVEFALPNGERTGLFFTIQPTSSTDVKKAEASFIDGQYAKRNNRMTVAKSETLVERRLLAAVIDWRFEGEANWNGETPEFSKKILKEMLQLDVITDFLNQEVCDQAAFFDSSVSN